MSQRLVWHTVSIAIVMIAQAVMASAPGHGYAAHRTRLNFGDPGTIELYDVQRARTTLGEDPVPGFDPSNPLRGTVVMAVRGPSAEAHSSSMSYTFRETEPLPELHIGFRMYIQHHANMDGLGDLQFLQLLDTGGGELLKAYNGAGGSWFQLGTQLSGYQISTP
ncbi:MAG: hypothetical protein GY723_07575, partial [bacterium]|nr:hypothetical protein [bacterium]